MVNAWKQHDCHVRRWHLQKIKLKIIRTSKPSKMQITKNLWMFFFFLTLWSWKGRTGAVGGLMTSVSLHCNKKSFLQGFTFSDVKANCEHWTTLWYFYSKQGDDTWKMIPSMCSLLALKWTSPCPSDIVTLNVWYPKAVLRQGHRS